MYTTPDPSMQRVYNQVCKTIEWGAHGEKVPGYINLFKNKTTKWGHALSNRSFCRGFGKILSSTLNGSQAKQPPFNMDPFCAASRQRDAIMYEVIQTIVLSSAYQWAVMDLTARPLPHNAGSVGCDCTWLKRNFSTKLGLCQVSIDLFILTEKSMFLPW